MNGVLKMASNQNISFMHHPIVCVRILCIIISIPYVYKQRENRRKGESRISAPYIFSQYNIIIRFHEANVEKWQLNWWLMKCCVTHFFLFVHLFWLGVKVDKIEHVPLKYLNVQIGWLASIFYHIHSIWYCNCNVISIASVVTYDTIHFLSLSLS